MMKRHTNNSKKLLGSIGALGLLSLLLSSCLKDTSNYNSPPTALVAFIQASPDEPPLNLYFNSNKVNENPINYGDNLDYFSAYAGQRTVNLYEASIMTALAHATVTLTANNAYSLFLANTTANSEIVLLNDTLNKPAAGFASVRFVDMSPDAPAVNLVVQNGPVLVSNKLFKGYSSFLPITGNSFYTFQIVKTGTSTVLATTSNLTFNAGYIYTIWFYGLASTTNSADKLSAGVITNAFFY